MIEGDFVKFNSNTGYTNGADVMQALSHFSFDYSGGQEVLCDLQGGRFDSCYVLTDPVIMSRAGEYGVTDLGASGISNFFFHHKCVIARCVTNASLPIANRERICRWCLLAGAINSANQAGGRRLLR
jgi:hypothetical protein